MFPTLIEAVNNILRTRVAIASELPESIPGAFPPGDPVYTLPPEEMQPEISIMAELLSTFAADQRDWGHVNLGIEELQTAGYTGSGVLVAIADTGIDYSHPDLKDRMILESCKDFTGSPAGFMDRQGHGTHCAGIVAASSNGAGLIGCAPDARLITCKVLGDQGSGASTWIANGIRHAANVGADIVSLSLGGPQPDNGTRAAIDYAIEKGVWIVCAAGNDGGPAQSYPGHYPTSIAVAASDRNNKRASFSTINRENDITAPGVSIMSCLPAGRYGQMSGTSMATPYVAGCLALVRGAIKKAGVRMPTQGELMTALIQTAVDLASPGRDSETGAGLVNPKGLIAALVSANPNPPNPPNPTPGDWMVQKVLTIKGNGTKPTTVTLN